MAEINAKDLTAKTSPATTDSMLLFGTTSNEGAKITVDNLADNILERLATKTFPNQVGGSSAATILAQLATLNSKIDGVKAYTIKGNQYFSLNASEATESVPSGVLVFGFHHVALVQWASTGVGFNNVITILAPAGNEVLTLSGNRVYTGSDGNRRLTILAPKQIGITIETS